MINYLAPDFSDLPGRRVLSRKFSLESAVCDRVDVSIVTPFYNTEEFFEETFASVQAQSMQNWEWVIVDDGSSDEGSIQRLNGVCARDSRIKVFRQANQGPAAARNTAFRSTCGRYICLLDSDDMIEPTYLEKCIWFLDSYPEFAFCNSCSVVFGDQNYLWTLGFERGKAHLTANSGPPISVIRRSAYEACGGFDESIRFGHEDWDFWLSMANVGHWGYTIPEFLQWYRKRSNGRFETIMRSEEVNSDFEELVQRKFAGLEARFPEPTRRHQIPYDTIESRAFVCNPLTANSVGRRILFIIPWMVPGGADRVNLDLIEGVTARGHDVTVCATLSVDHGWEHEFSRFTPDIFVLPNFLHATDYPRFLAYLIQSRQIDSVIVSGSTIGYQLLPYLRSVSPNTAFVDMCHVEEPHWLNGGHPRFGVGYQDLLDINITTTSHLANWCRERGAEADRIRVMYTGVRSVPATEEARVRIRTEFGIEAHVPVIVFAGRICEQKRPLLLADILKHLCEGGVVFQALIIGDGELKSQLMKLLCDYRLNSCVQVLGSVSHQRWLEVLAASDIFLMPSGYEGISVALLEALAAGVVPVGALVGGQGEIVTAELGVLIAPGPCELQEYVSAVRRLLTDSQSLRAMSRQCRAYAAAELSWEATIDRFLGILDEAHHFRITKPRQPISLRLGRELASQALEIKRLGEAVDWLWSGGGKGTAHAELPVPSAEAQGAARLAIVLTQTKFGQALARNRWMLVVGRWMLHRLSKASVA